MKFILISKQATTQEREVGRFFPTIGHQKKIITCSFGFFLGRIKQDKRREGIKKCFTFFLMCSLILFSYTPKKNFISHPQLSFSRWLLLLIIYDIFMSLFRANIFSLNFNIYRSTSRKYVNQRRAESNFYLCSATVRYCWIC